MEYQKSD